MRILFILFLFFQNGGVVYAEEKLFENNQWRAVIVIPDNPEINEWYAARSLGEWAEIITGKKIALLSESESLTSNSWKIYIGKTNASFKNQIKAPTSSGDSATRIIKDKSIFLIGSNPGATRIAVGRFCEQVFGITFCQPGIQGADYTLQNEIAVPGADFFKPAYQWRAVGGLSNEISKDWAYSVGYGDYPAFSHNFYKIFTENEWQLDPSFFAAGDQGYLKPTGSGNDANPNLNHPQAIQIVRRYIDGWFENNPDSISVPMGLNDSSIFDKSAPSEGWFRNRPVRTHYLINFLNKVLDEYELNKNSEVRRTIGTLAYLDTLKAPTIKANRDIFPWICVDRMGYVNTEFRQQDIDNCTAWIKSGVDNVGAYDYWYGNNFCIPRINFSVQADSIKSLSAIGIKGWYAELYPLWAFDAPKAWLGVKLLENPNSDPEILLKKWFKSAYGPADQSMRNIFEIIESTWSHTNQSQGKDQWLYGIFEESTGEMMSDKSIQEILFNLAEAEKILITNNSKQVTYKNYLWRFNQFKEFWKLSEDYRQVVRLRKVHPSSPEEALEALKNLVKAENALELAQSQLNFRWGTVSQKTHWAQFTPTNPREKWIKMIRQNSQLESELIQCTQQDTIGKSIFYLAWESKNSEVKTILSTHTLESFNKDWLCELNQRKNSEPLNQNSLLAVINQSGQIRHSEKIGPKQLVKLFLSHNPMGGDIKLVLNFKGHDRSLSRSQQVSDANESLLVLSPAWTEQVEFCIQFDNAIDLKALEISQLSP